MNGSSLRDILPLLRPRSAEPTLFTQTVWYLLWIGVAVLVILYLYRLYRQRKQRHKVFLAYCQDMGITEGQIRLLERIARARKLQQPERLLSNAHAFERQVGAFAQDLARRHPKHKLLRRISRLREDLGFDRLPTDQALISSRQIDRGQTVMVTDVDENSLEEILVPWLILDRDEAHLQLSPLLKEAAGHEHRRGELLTIRFWREGDTEYEFQTRVRSVHGQNMSLYHATRVERRQHRDFYRIHVDFPLDLYGLAQAEEQQSSQPHDEAAIALLDEEESAVPSLPAQETETGPQMSSEAVPDIPIGAERLHGRVTNLSAGGLAILLPAGTLPTGSLPADGEPAQWVWMVDPAFEGDYPLAGVTCRAVSGEPQGGQQLVKMQFEELPTLVEKEIVQRVYQHQLEAAGGLPAPVRSADTADIDDDTDTSQDPPDETSDPTSNPAGDAAA